MTRPQVAGLLGLSLWSSASWLTGDLMPSTGKPVAGAGFRLLLVGCAGLFVYFVRRRGVAINSIARLCLVGTGSLGLVGLPFLLLTFVQGRIGASLGVVVFAITPIVMMVASAASRVEPVGLRLLPYGLLGVAGILALVPVQIPGDGRGMTALGLLILAMMLGAVCAIWVHRLLGELTVAAALAVIGFGNGSLLTLFGGFSAIRAWSLHEVWVEGLRCCLFDLPEMILLVWLIQTVSPQRLSARYVIAPLLTVVEGLLVARPRFETRALMGLVMLGVGAYGLVRAGNRQEETGLTLR